MTRQRKAILEAVRASSAHPSADDVYRGVRRKLPRVSLGTVYRNLEALSELGLILELGRGSAQKRFDGRTDDHYHLRCTGCGRVEDVRCGPFEEIERAVERLSGQGVTGYSFEFSGLCRSCRGAEAGGGCAQ